MLKKLIMTAGLAALLSAPAMAAEEAEANCATLLKQVDAALEQSQLDDAGKAKAQEMKAKAEEQMKAGDEDGCKATASEILDAVKG